jgi:hypothetical protein
MIYQNPYQNIRTADIYGARKQAAQDQLAEQENQLALQQNNGLTLLVADSLLPRLLLDSKT